MTLFFRFKYYFQIFRERDLYCFIHIYIHTNSFIYVAGPWFTSQYDNYPPAASAATLAFEQAFPSTKLNKFITFCQEEILNYIYESLIKHIPQTLSNPK